MGFYNYIEKHGKEVVYVVMHHTDRYIENCSTKHAKNNSFIMGD